MLNLTAYARGVDAPREKPHGAHQRTEGPAINFNTAILPPLSTIPTDKQYATVTAQLALNGHTLIRSVQGDRTIFTCSRWGQSRNFSVWSDVCAFSNQVGGGK